MKLKVLGPFGQHLVRTFLSAASGKFLKGHTEERPHREKGIKSEMRQIQFFNNPLMRWSPMTYLAFTRLHLLKVPPVSHSSTRDQASSMSVGDCTHLNHSRCISSPLSHQTQSFYQLCNRCIAQALLFGCRVISLARKLGPCRAAPGQADFPCGSQERMFRQAKRSYILMCKTLSITSA